MATTQPCRFLLAVALFVTALLPPPSLVRAGECTRDSCTKNKCDLPACNCVSRFVPGDKNFAPGAVPQLVVFAFVGPLNGDSWHPLRRLFKDDKTNPNGEPITMTLFVADAGTDDYCRAGQFYGDGHEIGVNGVNETEATDTFKSSDWEELIMSQKEKLTTEAAIDKDDISGIHVPNPSKTGALFLAMEHMSDEAEYKSRAWKPYDCSVVLGDMTRWNNCSQLWPYTANYRFPDDRDCPAYNNPANCFDGVWEVPIRRFYDNDSSPLDFIDDWTNPEDEEMLYYTLVNNFWEHYATSRAPFVVKAHTDWFKKSALAEKVLEKFINRLRNHDLHDVYIVSMEQMLEWVKDPKELSEIKESDLFRRTKKRSGARCSMGIVDGKGGMTGTTMLLFETAVLLVLLVAFIAKDRAED